MNVLRYNRAHPRSTVFGSLPPDDMIYRDDRWKVDSQTGYLTQEEQDKEDDKNRREAMRDLVESWMDRLQLISVITTFFASTEASMITITAPTSDGTPISTISQMANIGIMGALVVHSNAGVCWAGLGGNSSGVPIDLRFDDLAAIISFLAAFYLIRYKLKVAKSEEAQATGSKQKEVVESPTVMSTFHGAERAERAPRPSINSEHETDPIPGMVRISSPLSPSRPIYSTNPHLVQVGPFQGHPPTHLLGRCHALCIFLTVLGFVLALMGILCFAWERLPLSVSISASFFMALCMFAGLYIWMEPEPEEGTSSHIYYKGR